MPAGDHREVQRACARCHPLYASVRGGTPRPLAGRSFAACRVDDHRSPCDRLRERDRHEGRRLDRGVRAGVDLEREPVVTNPSGTATSESHATDCQLVLRGWTGEFFHARARRRRSAAVASRRELLRSPDHRRRPHGRGGIRHRVRGDRSGSGRRVAGAPAREPAEAPGARDDPRPVRARLRIAGEPGAGRAAPAPTRMTAARAHSLEHLSGNSRSAPLTRLHQ